MEVILKSDVDNLGYKDDTGYGKERIWSQLLDSTRFGHFGYLLRRKFWLKTSVQRAHKEAKLIEAANQSAEALNRVELKLTAKSGKGGKLFGAVTNANVADELAALGHGIEKKFIQIAGGTIKAAGKYTAKVRLHREVVVDFTFEVIGDEN